MKNNEEKFCGECCWFYGEDTYGYGICPFRFAETKECSQKCEVLLKYVSKKEMRHHMAVLLLIKRWYAAPGGASCRIPSENDMINALDFAYRYMKVFSEL